MAERARVVVDADAGEVVREGARAENAIRGVGKAAKDAAREAGIWQDQQGRWREANGRFVSVARQAELGLDRLNRQQQRSINIGRAWSAAVDRQRRTLQGMVSTARTAGLVLGGGAIYGGQRVLRDGIRFNAQVESAELALRRYVGGAQEAEEFTARLFETAKRTPFEFTDVLEASRRLMSFGMSAKQTTELLDAMGDAIAAAGGGAEQIQRVSTALGQIQAKGKVYAEELLQLTEAGIPAYAILARELGMTGDQVASIGQAGVDAKTAIDALTRGLKEDFAGAAAEQAQTWEGLTSTIRDNWAQMTGALTANLFDAARDWAPAVNDAMEAVAETWRRTDIGFEEKFEISRDQIARRLGPVFDEIGDEIAKMDLDEKLLDAIERAVPAILDGLASAGFKGAEVFVRGWLEAGAWGKLLGAAWLLRQTGALAAFGSLGRQAGDKFVAAMKKRMAGTAAGEGIAGAIGASVGASAAGKKIDEAGDKAGKRFGKAFGIGVAAGVALLLPDLIKQIEESFVFDPKRWGEDIGKKLGELLGTNQDRGGRRSSPTETALAIGEALGGASGGSARLGNQGRRAKITPGTAATGGRGKVIGTPGAGTHTLGNWQSDNAVDIRIERGSPILAVESGTVEKVSIKPDGGGRFAGSSVTIRGSSGNRYFYAHLASVSVRKGERVRGGQQIGTSGVANGVPHLHFATEKGDPRQARLSGGQRVITRLNPRQRTVAEAAARYGIDPAVLWGVYGVESSFGRNTGPSSAGARGPFQIMPATARELGLKPGEEMDFRKAAFAAARYLARFKNRGTRGMLAAYNAGPNADPSVAGSYPDDVLRLARRFPTIDVAGGGRVDVRPTDIAEIQRALAERLLRPIARRRQRDLRPLNRLAGRYRRRAEQFGSALEQARAFADLTEEDIATPEGRAARIGELTTIRNLQLNQGYANQQRLSVIRRQIAVWAAAVKRMRALLKTARGAQRGVIKARIEKYRDKIRELQAEAKALGETITGLGLDIVATMDEIADTETEGRAQQAERERERWQQGMSAIGALVALSPDLNDDVAFAQTRVGIAQKLLADAMTEGDPLKIAEAANDLKEASDQLKAAAEAIETRTLQRNDAALLGAQILTPDDKSDDRAVLQQRLDYAKPLFLAAVANDDVEGVLKWGPIVQSATQALKDLDETLNKTNDQLADLYKQQRDEALRGKAVSDAQFGVFKGFAPRLAGRMIGSFARGALSVPEDGLALVHKDETIIPAPDGPHRMAARDMLAPAAAPVFITLHAEGDLGPVLSRVRASVSGGAGQVSLEQGRRTRLIRAAPGGR